jgi:hypothetical protein
MTVTLTGAAVRRLTPLRLALLTPALLAACSTAPLSFIEGRPISQVEANLQPLTVVAIDGRMEGGTRASVGPGMRSVVLAAPPARGMRTGTAKAFAMNVEPCTRYLVAARRASPMSPDWQLVVQDKEKVAGCDPSEEWRKTGQPAPAAAPAGAPAPAPAPQPAPAS